MKEKYIEKECKHHGLTTYILEPSRGSYRCKKCRVAAVHKRRKHCKQTIATEHGGKCTICNYSKCVEALDFHHVNPAEKSFGLGSGNTWSLKKLRLEAAKCVLLCRNCHAEVEMGITTI